MGSTALVSKQPDGWRVVRKRIKLKLQQTLFDEQIAPASQHPHHPDPQGPQQPPTRSYGNITSCHKQPHQGIATSPEQRHAAPITDAADTG